MAPPARETERAPTISVAICLYDSRRWIAETLASVLAQTWGDFELLLVDDGSRDGCLDEVRHSFIDPRLRLFRQQNQGLGSARQAALLRARGEFVAFLDHDDLWRPDKLERQLRAARAQPQAGLVFSDCELIDAAGRRLGRRLSDQHEFARIGLESPRVHEELLRRGCFVDLSTVVARTAALHAAGGFDPRYRYVEDLDMWLRLGRRASFVFVPEALTLRRVHDRQFTRVRPEVALREQVQLLRAVTASATFPRGLRTAVGDYLFGQHRECAGRLLESGRWFASLVALVTAVRLPGRAFDWLRHRTRATSLGRLLERVSGWASWVAARMARPLQPPGPPRGVEVWIDGSPLGEAQTGYFNLVVELVRALLEPASGGAVVHVVTGSAGRAALRARLGGQADRLRLHATLLGAPHWTTVHRWLSHWSLSLVAAAAWGGLFAAALAGRQALLLPACALAVLHLAAIADGWLAELRSALGAPRLPLLARGLRFLQRVLRAPRPGGCSQVVEVVIWRGRFRHAGSTRLAIVPDLTPKLHPELHTPGNVLEFDEYLRYAVRHAERIVTLSESSRHDIVERLPVHPGAVDLMPMRVHPVFLEPDCSPGVVRLHGIEGPYLLFVGTVEPRKNLRRLVKAFEAISGEPCAREHTLVLAGPEGWDGGFDRFLAESDVRRRVRRLGFVPLEHLPSLYRCASAFVYPSLYEGYGLPVLEAMCCSALVLASRVSSLPEVLGDGLAFDPYRTDEIAAVLRRALSLTAAEQCAGRERCRARARALLQAARGRPPLPGLPG